jgi:hypothetical protein
MCASGRAVAEKDQRMPSDVATTDSKSGLSCSARARRTSEHRRRDRRRRTAAALPSRRSHAERKRRALWRGAAHSFDLGTLDGIRLSLTDAEALGGNRTAFAATAEDTADTVLDGPVAVRRSALSKAPMPVGPRAGRD